MLNVKNIKINRSSKSLNHKNINSFKIIKIINNIIYKLKLSKKNKHFFYLLLLIIIFKQQRFIIKLNKIVFFLRTSMKRKRITS